LVGNSLANPPALARFPQAEEVEVSLFGPGYGECILVHLGHNEWMVVDSCLTKDKIPTALEYLRVIGVNPAEAVKLIVATHWHDDHIGGIGTVLSECTAAKLVCSDALRTDEFLLLVQAMKKRSMMSNSGVDEFNKVMNVLVERSASPRRELATPNWAVADRLLWRRIQNGQSLLPCEVHSLSPSDASITLGRHEIAGLIQQERTPKKRITARSPNHVAVVLWVRTGATSILLGSDLEETREPGTGWSVIVDSITRPIGNAAIFKVPHHGSVNADQPRVWREMLINQPFAILTPFMRGNKVLPTKEDARRTCARTDTAYSTATTKAKQSKPRANTVNKQIQQTVRYIREVPSSAGHIRLRKMALAPDEVAWEVELFGKALALKQLCA
jgi:hypothetical protein